MEKLNSQIVIYKDQDGNIKIDVRFDGDTVWLTQNSLAELFQTTKQNIGQHIKNIIEEGELLENSTVKKFFTVQKEGNREVKRGIVPTQCAGGAVFGICHGTSPQESAYDYERLDRKAPWVFDYQ